MDHSTPTRGLTFGRVAEGYERYRLDYPDEIADEVLRFADRPVRVALEIGAGTGKATRLFASRGVAVTALEPDDDMAGVLDRTTHGLPVTSVRTTFEAFTTDRRFDLVYAAAAWHWTDPATRCARAVDLLVPGGVLALLGRPSEVRDPGLLAAVEEVERRLLPDDPLASHLRYVDELAAADGLTNATELTLPRVVTTTAADFVGRLATVSAYLVLDPELRAEALRQIRDVLPEQFELDATVHLSLARRG